MTTMRDRHRVVDLRIVEGKKGWQKPRGYHLLSWLRWEYEYKLDEATAERATWDIPSWAQSPTAGIIGTWHAIRRRLVTRLGIPLGPWRAT
jgi:hypothetical protein